MEVFFRIEMEKIVEKQNENVVLDTHTNTHSAHSAEEFCFRLFFVSGVYWLTVRSRRRSFDFWTLVTSWRCDFIWNRIDEMWTINWISADCRIHFWILDFLCFLFFASFYTWKIDWSRIALQSKTSLIQLKLYRNRVASVLIWCVFFCLCKPDFSIGSLFN